MNATIIGISSGVITIFLFLLFKRLDKKIIYGLIWGNWFSLCRIYMDRYYHCNHEHRAGNIFFNACVLRDQKEFIFSDSRLFMHGLWDLIYRQFADPSLLPPHYDLFC